MIVPTTTGTTPDKNYKPATAGRRPVLLLGALLLCAAALFANCRPGPATAAESFQAAGYAPAQANEAAGPGSLATTPSIWPAKGPVTSGFGWRLSPFGDGNELHPGVDIAYPAGAPVVATADGQVVQSGWCGGYGNMVQIDHGNGLATIYGHNSQLAVSVGQAVKKGQIISYAGSSGKSTGPHVHYEIRIDNAAVDPWRYMVLY